MTNPNEKKIPSFRDAAGREWHLVLTLGTARRVKAEAGVDIGQVANGKAFVDLASDDEKLCAALWVLCEKQAERLGVSPEQFAEGLGGDAFDAAMLALEEAIVLFSRSHQRRAVKTMLAKTLVAMEQAGAAIATKIEAEAQTVTSRAIDEALSAPLGSGGGSPPSRP